MKENGLNKNGVNNMTAFNIEQIHNQMMTLFGVGYDQHIGEYWEVLSPYEGNTFHTTVFHLRRLNPSIQEYHSLVRLIELSGEQHQVSNHTLDQWHKRVSVGAHILFLIEEMEVLLKDVGYKPKEYCPEWDELLTLTRSGCTLPGKTVEKRLRYWVKHVETSTLTVDRRPYTNKNPFGICFMHKVKRNGKLISKSYRLSLDDIFDIEDMIHHRYRMLLKQWMRLSVLSLRSCEELSLIFEEGEWQVLQSKGNRYSVKQLSYWMDRAGKTIPMEALEEWYDWETEGA